MAEGSPAEFLRAASSNDSVYCLSKCHFGLFPFSSSRSPRGDDRLKTGVQLGRVRIDPETAPLRSAICERRAVGVIEKILAHVKNKASYTEPAMLPDGRAPPPQAHLFNWTKKTINDLTALHASVQSGFYWTAGRHWAEIEEKQGGAKNQRLNGLGAPS